MEEQKFNDALVDIRKALSEEQLSMMFDGSYPIRLIIKPDYEGFDGQMNMLEKADTDPTAKKSSMTLRYICGELLVETVGRMRIEDETYRKVRTKFKQACLFYMAYIHRLAMDNEMISRTKFGGEEQ